MYMFMYLKRCILKKWRVNVKLASKKSPGRPGAGKEAGVDAADLKQNFFFSEKLQYFPLRPPSDWVRPSYIREVIYVTLSELIWDANHTLPFYKIPL